MTRVTQNTQRTESSSSRSVNVDLAAERQSHSSSAAAANNVLRRRLGDGTICAVAIDTVTHSFRQGGSTYAQSFSGFYNMSDVYLKVGWSIGRVQDYYIFQTTGGDQARGRVLCGLFPNDVSCATV